MGKPTYRVVQQKDMSFAVEIMAGGASKRIPGFFSELEADAWIQQNSTEISKRPKRPRDLNQWAKRMVDIATGDTSDREPTSKERGGDTRSGPG
jgi:hypothetical protein